MGDFVYVLKDKDGKESILVTGSSLGDLSEMRLINTTKEELEKVTGKMKESSVKLFI